MYFSILRTEAGRATLKRIILISRQRSDKILASAYSVYETEIKKGADPITERAIFQDLVRLTEKELFERCKEIFHTSFKTRKAGKEAYNPIRDGKGAFRGKAVNEGISRFVWDLDAIMRDFGKIGLKCWISCADNCCRAGNQVA